MAGRFDAPQTTWRRVHGTFRNTGCALGYFG